MRIYYMRMISTMKNKLWYRDNDILKMNKQSVLNMAEGPYTDANSISASRNSRLSSGSSSIARNVSATLVS